MKFPAWFNRDRHGRSAILVACAHRGMTAEQVIDVLLYESEYFQNRLFDYMQKVMHQTGKIGE